MGDAELVAIALEPTAEQRLERNRLLVETQRAAILSAAAVTLRRWRRAMLATVAVIVAAAAAYGAVSDRRSTAAATAARSARDSLAMLKAADHRQAGEIARLSGIVVQLEQRRLAARAAFTAKAETYDSLRAEYDAASAAADSAAVYRHRSDGDSTAAPLVPLPDARPVLDAASSAVAACRVALNACELSRDSTEQLLALTRAQLAIRTSERDLTASLVPTSRQRWARDAKVAGAAIVVLTLGELLAAVLR